MTNQYPDTSRLPDGVKDLGGAIASFYEHDLIREGAGKQSIQREVYLPTPETKGFLSDSDRGNDSQVQYYKFNLTINRNAPTEIEYGGLYSMDSRRGTTTLIDNSPDRSPFANGSAPKVGLDAKPPEIPREVVLAQVEDAHRNNPNVPIISERQDIVIPAESPPIDLTPSSSSPAKQTTSMSELLNLPKPPPIIEPKSQDVNLALSELKYEAFKQATAEEVARGDGIVTTEEIASKTNELLAAQGNVIQVPDSAAQREALNIKYAAFKANAEIDAANDDGGKDSPFRLTPADEKALAAGGVKDADKIQDKIDAALASAAAATGNAGDSEPGAADFGIGTPTKSPFVFEEARSDGGINKVVFASPEVIVPDPTNPYDVVVKNNPPPYGPTALLASNKDSGAPPSTGDPLQDYAKGFTSYFENIPKPFEGMARQWTTGKNDVTLNSEAEGDLYAAIIEGGRAAFKGEPEEFAKQLADYANKLAENPAYYIGSVVGSAAFTAATFGVGPAVKAGLKGVGMATKAIRAVDVEKEIFAPLSKAAEKAGSGIAKAEDGTIAIGTEKAPAPIFELKPVEIGPLKEPGYIARYSFVPEPPKPTAGSFAGKAAENAAIEPVKVEKVDTVLNKDLLFSNPKRTVQYVTDVAEIDRKEIEASILREKPRAPKSGEVEVKSPFDRTDRNLDVPQDVNPTIYEKKVSENVDLSKLIPEKETVNFDRRTVDVSTLETTPKVKRVEQTVTSRELADFLKDEKNAAKIFGGTDTDDILRVERGPDRPSKPFGTVGPSQEAEMKQATDFLGTGNKEKGVPNVLAGGEGAALTAEDTMKMLYGSGGGIKAKGSKVEGTMI